MNTIPGFWKVAPQNGNHTSANYIHGTSDYCAFSVDVHRCCVMPQIWQHIGLYIDNILITILLALTCWRTGRALSSKWTLALSPGGRSSTCMQRARDSPDLWVSSPTCIPGLSPHAPTDYSVLLRILFHHVVRTMMASLLHLLFVAHEWYFRIAPTHISSPQFCQRFAVLFIVLQRDRRWKIDPTPVHTSVWLPFAPLTASFDGIVLCVDSVLKTTVSNLVRRCI